MPLHSMGSSIALSSAKHSGRIVNLNVVQKQEGLRAANKLTDGHINFENQKMKVSLAAQVFSRSVSCALAYMRKLKHTKRIYEHQRNRIVHKFC